MLQNTERWRRLATNVLGAILPRFVNIASNLVIVPLTVSGLGVNDYGALAVILSTLMIFAYFDLGLSLAVVNRVASINDERSLLEARRAIATVWNYLIRISLVIVGLSIPIIIIVEVTGICGADFPWGTWMCLVLCTAIGLAPSLTQRILFGLQRNLEANVWNSVARVFSVIAVYLAYLNNATMPWYIVSIVGLPSIVGWVNTIFLWREIPDLKPVSSIIDRSKLFNYVRDGIKFSILQICLFFETGIDNILIGFVQGTAFVADYDLLVRLFIYVPALVSMLAFPLWPAIAQAKANDDAEWVRQLTKLLFFIVAIVSTVASSVLLYLHPQILNLWVGLQYKSNFELAVPIAAFAVLNSIGTLQSVIMNGLGIVSEQARIAVVFLTFLIPIKFMALSFSGQSLMVWSLVFIYAIRLIFLWRISGKNC